MAYLTVDEEQNKIRKKFMDDSSHLVRLERVEENDLYGEKTVINAFDYNRKKDNVPNASFHTEKSGESQNILSAKIDDISYSPSQTVWNTSMKGIEPAYEPYLFQDEAEAEMDFVKLKSEYYGMHSGSNVDSSDNQDNLPGVNNSALDLINSGIEISIGSNPVFFAPIHGTEKFDDTKENGVSEETTEEPPEEPIPKVTEPLTFQDVLEMSEKSGVQVGIKNKLNDEVDLSPNLLLEENNEPTFTSLNQDISYDVFPENVFEDAQTLDNSNYITEQNPDDVEVIPIVSSIRNNYVTEGLGIDYSEENREHLQDLFYEKYPSADEIQFGEQPKAVTDVTDTNNYFEDPSSDVPQFDDNTEIYEEPSLHPEQPEMQQPETNNQEKEYLYSDEQYDDSFEEEYAYFEEDQLPYYEVEEPTLVEPNNYISDEGPYITETESFENNNYVLNTAYVEQDNIYEEDQSYIEDIPIQEEEETKKKSSIKGPVIVGIIVLVLLIIAIALLLVTKKTGFTFHLGSSDFTSIFSEAKEQFFNGYTL